MIWSYLSSCSYTASDGLNKYVNIPTIRHLTFRNNSNFEQTRICTSCRYTKRERPRPTPAGLREPSSVKRVQETAGREVDLSSSYLEDNS